MKLKFEGGGVQILPHAILTANYTHTINLYIDTCTKLGIETLSFMSLWRILKSLKPSQQKSLAGLDDTTADGLNGFKALEDLCQKLGEKKKNHPKLERGKRYLKFKYQGHCEELSSIESHCATCALSDPKDEAVSCVPNNHHHTERCLECHEILDTIDEIISFITLSDYQDKEDMLYDADACKKKVTTWMKHIMRHSAKQSKNRSI